MAFPLQSTTVPICVCTRMQLMMIMIPSAVNTLPPFPVHSCPLTQFLGVFRFDRLMPGVADYSSSFSEDEQFFSGCSRRNKSTNTTTTSFHQTTNSSRFIVSGPHQSLVSRPWYDSMLANRVHRRTYDQRGTKYGHEMIPVVDVWKHMEDGDKTRTVSNSTSDDEVDAVERDFGEKLTGVQLVLVVMDVFLVIHRLLTVCSDVQSLNSTPSQPAAEATPAGVNSPTADVDVTAKTSLAELRPQNVIQLKTVSHRNDVEQLVGSQSQCSSWSCDRRICSTRNVVDLQQCFVVVLVSVGVSVFVLLPVAMVGGPTHVGTMLSRLVLPSLPATVLPLPGSTDHRHDVDGERSSTEVHRQHVEFELRQLLALRQLHGMYLRRRPNG